MILWSLSRLSDFRDEIEKALAYDGGCYTIEDVAKEIDEGRALLWDGGDAIVVTVENHYPRKKEMRIWFAAGQGGMDTVVNKLQPMIVGFARGRGIDVLTFTGRRGWMRSELLRTGWAVAPTVEMYREIEYGQEEQDGDDHHSA